MPICLVFIRFLSPLEIETCTFVCIIWSNKPAATYLTHSPSKSSINMCVSLTWFVWDALLVSFQVFGVILFSRKSAYHLPTDRVWTNARSIPISTSAQIHLFGGTDSSRVRNHAITICDRWLSMLKFTHALRQCRHKNCTLSLVNLYHARDVYVLPKYNAHVHLHRFYRPIFMKQKKKSPLWTELDGTIFCFGISVLHRGCIVEQHHMNKILREETYSKTTKGINILYASFKTYHMRSKPTHIHSNNTLSHYH